MQKRGFTLIEVVIALVIFLVGALAVVRIFPASLGIVQNSGDSTVAMRLSDSLINRMKAEGSTPQAVFDIDDTDEIKTDLADWTSDNPKWPIEAYWKDADVSVVGTSTKNDSLPDGPTEPEYEASALSKFRFVRGEKHEIQNADGSDAANDAPYLLTNFPYTAAPAGGIRLYVNLDITRVSINQDGRLNFSRAKYTNPFTGKEEDFHVGTGANALRPLELVRNETGAMGAGSNYAALLFRSPIGGSPVNTGARFYVSYKYVDGISDKANRVINEPLNLPDNNNWDEESNVGNDDVNYVLQGLLRKKLAAADKPVIIPGNVQVTAHAELLFTSTLPTINDIAGGAAIPLGVDSNNAIRGFVELPPVFSATGPSTKSLMPQVPISVDYLVPSWSLLTHQSVSDRNGKVFLPINLLDKDFLPVGLVANQNASDIPALPTTPTAVDYKQGEITYSPPSPYSNFSVPIRTVYKGLDQWTSQVSPTAKSYVPFNNNSAIASFRDPLNPEFYYLPFEPWREYYWAYDADTDPDIIYFHASEAGKTVQVSFIPSGGTQAIQQILTISDTITSIPPNAYTSTGAIAVLQLTDSNGLPIDVDGILGVRGMSVVARTAWLNGESYDQVVANGYRTNAN